MIEINKVLQKKFCVLSVIGPHAGESMSQIYERKIQDIQKVGKTFWITQCKKSIFEKINELCMNGDLYIVFISPSSKNGARPATSETAASGYIVNDIFQPFPKQLSPVTGKITTRTAALVFDELELFDIPDAPMLDTWNYLDATTNTPVRFVLGGSTKICILNTATVKEGMKSRYRRISAIGRFATPFCVRPVAKQEE